MLAIRIQAEILINLLDVLPLLFFVFRRQNIFKNLFGGQAALGIYTVYVKQLGRGKIWQSKIGNNSSGVPALAKQAQGVKFKFYHRLMEPQLCHFLRHFAPLLLTVGSGGL